VNLTTISYPDKGKIRLPFYLNVFIGLTTLSFAGALPGHTASSQLQPVLKAIDPSLAKYDTSKPTDQPESASPNPGGTVNGAPIDQPHYTYQPYDDSQTPSRLRQSSYPAPQMVQPQSSEPHSGEPPSGPPQLGQPQPRKLQSGKLQPGKPQSGQPKSGQPQLGQPQSGQPQSGQPKSGQPQLGQPQSGQPQLGQPQAGYLSPKMDQELPPGSQPQGQAPNGFLTGIPAPTQTPGGPPSQQGQNGGFPDESSIPSFQSQPSAGTETVPEVSRGPAQTPPPLAPTINDMKKLARLEQAVFGASYPDHDFSARLDHVEKEALGKVTDGTTAVRLTRLEATVGSNQAAFDSAPSSDNTGKIQVTGSFGKDDIARVIQAIPTKKNAGDYFNNVKPITSNAYARWTHFPIRVRLPQDSPETWRKEMEADVEKWNHITPIKLASPQEQADIEVVWVNHIVPRLLGITRLIVVNGSIRVQIYILRPTFYLLAVPERSLGAAFTHELGHALGLYGHSNTPGDIMFPVELNIDGRLSIPPNATISPRDINTLKKIYESPALPGNVNLPRPLEWGFGAFQDGEKTCPL